MTGKHLARNPEALEVMAIESSVILSEHVTHSLWTQWSKGGAYKDFQDFEVLVASVLRFGDDVRKEALKEAVDAAVGAASLYHGNTWKACHTVVQAVGDVKWER